MSESIRLQSKQFVRWREKLSYRLARAMLFFGGPVVLYTLLVENLQTGLFVSFLYFLLLCIHFVKSLPFKVRVYTLVVIPSLVGVEEILGFGVLGGSRLYFALSVLLAILLLGGRAGLVTLLTTSSFFIVAAYLSVTGNLSVDVTALSLSQETYWWTWFIGTYLFSVGTAAYSVHYLFKRLQKSFHEIEQSSAEKGELIEANVNSNRRFQLLAENVTDVIWTTDFDLNLTFVSPSILACLGYTPEEAIGMNVSAMGLEMTPEEMKSSISAALEGDLDPSAKIGPLKLELQLKHKHGHLIDVEMHITFLRNEKGKPVGTLGVSRDVTDRKRLERAMESVLTGSTKKFGAELFSSLTENLQQTLQMRTLFVGIFNDDNTVSTLAVCQDGEIQENFVYDLENTPCDIALTEGCCSYSDNVQALFPKDELLFKMGMHSYIGVAILDREANPIGIMVAMDDKEILHLELAEKLLSIFASHAGAEIIRQKEEQEKETIRQQLVQSQKIDSIGQLAGGIAHDFNNLLVVINGYVELAKDSQEGDEELTEYLGEIHKASDRATALTRQLLSFSRQQIMETKTLSLNSVIEGLSGLLKRLIPESIAYQFIPMQALGMISGDKGQLEQAIINIVVNARDAMPEGGKLTIETENILIDQNYVDTHPWTKVGRFVLLRISDSGVGISAAMQERIFEPFFTTKPEGSGTGLGLSVYFGIVKQHDGFAHLYSEEGKGSEFRTYFPIVERKVSNVERRLEGKISRGHELILLVEDEEQVSKLASKILSRSGYAVILAEDGEVALQKFKDNADKIGLVLLDVVLPKLGGRDVMKAIRELNPLMPILFTSGYSKNGIHTNFILEDNLLLLQKPYSSENLIRRVRETIDAAKKAQ